MHNTVKNLIYIEDEIKSKANDIDNSKLPKIIAVSKTFSMDKILPLVEHGHTDYGENRVQEALDKWTDIKLKNINVKLHLIGGLQTNKVKLALKIFDYIHSLDSKKLANKIADEQIKQGKKPKIFIQINIGNESQKSGIKKDELVDFYKFCKQLNLNIIGLMCIPPANESSTEYFKKMFLLSNDMNLSELSMGMSSDYLEATKNYATYLRIGSSIFGQRN
tara:strand:+ start:147 stop:806 length:660 start_codon:yes stop_codon:yes gene_type:complete